MLTSETINRRDYFSCFMLRSHNVGAGGTTPEGSTSIGSNSRYLNKNKHAGKRVYQKCRRTMRASGYPEI